MPHNEQSLGEYMDITLCAQVDPAALLLSLQGTVPDGFGVHGITESR